MARVYISICSEADSLYIRLSKLVEKEVKYKVEIEKLMYKGFANIAKARYIMGSTWVTKLQLPTQDSNPIQPVATVCRALSDTHWVFHVHRRDVLTPTGPSEQDSENESLDKYLKDEMNGESGFNQEQSKNPVGYSEAAFKCKLTNDPKSLKKSKISYHVNDKVYKEYNEELLDELSIHSNSDDEVFPITDPIRLFGILVPNTLKEAQVYFKDVTILIGKCATLQSELIEVFQRYTHLENVKRLMRDAAYEAGIDILKPKIYWTPPETSSISHHEMGVESVEKMSKPSETSIQKSIRSVFFNADEVDQGEEEKLTVWSKESSEYGSEDSKEKD